MSAVRNIVSVLGIMLVASCTNSTSVSKFTYGANMPGTGLPEGGEIRHERVNLLGMPPQTWLMVYQYTAPAGNATAPFPDPNAVSNGGTGKAPGMWGNCVDERMDQTWPFSPIFGNGETYQMLPQVKVSGAGITGSLNVIETNPPNTAGNSTFRKYGFTYGGGAPGAMTGANFNATMTTAAMSTPGTDYVLDIGSASDDPKGTMTYHMPDAYTTPLGIGGAATVMIPAGKDLEFTWTPPAQDMGANGHTHTYLTHFNFTFFADPTNANNPPQFICFPDVDGHQLIPAAVIAALPTSGLIVNADLSHYLDAATGTDGTKRRFDLVSIFCNISTYKIQ